MVLIDEDLFHVVLGSVLVAVVAALAGAYLTATIVPTEFGELPSAPLDEIELTPGSLLLCESNVEINVVLGAVEAVAQLGQVQAAAVDQSGEDERAQREARSGDELIEEREPHPKAPEVSSQLG